MTGVANDVSINDPGYSECNSNTGCHAARDRCHACHDSYPGHNLSIETGLVRGCDEA